MNSIASFAISAKPLKCHVNGKGAKPEQLTCQPPYNKFCNYITDEKGDVTRNCSAGEGLWPEVRCIKTSKFTSCMCDTDNCNFRCGAYDCKPIQISRLDDPNPDIATYHCNATCEAEGKNTVLF